MTHADVFVFGRNKGKRGSFFSTVVVLDNGEPWFRCIPCGNLTTNQSELKAIELGLRVINPAFKMDRVSVHVGNRYIIGMLARDGDVWSKTPQTNKGLIERVRFLLGDYEFEVLDADKENKHFKFARKMLEDTCKAE